MKPHERRLGQRVKPGPVVYTLDMSFYYGSGQPPDEPKPGSLRETLSIVVAVFKVMALPIGLLMGSVLGLVLLIYSFTVSPWLGLGLLLLGAGAVAVFAFWERTRTPRLP